jgi:NAD(P)-dependent dehydrogenase (short-subunit alcohol dehydrogenase family)
VVRVTEVEEKQMVLDSFSVSGKTALVTGAGRGIGRAIALTLAEAGADVAVCARTKSQIEESAQLIHELGRKALPIALDVSKPDKIHDGVSRVVEEFGKIDILCSNAGIFRTGPITTLPGEKIEGWELTEGNWKTPLPVERWHEVLGTNLHAAFHFSQAVGPHMMKQKKGKVVIVSSTAAEEGQNHLSAYCVSKAGLNSLTRCLASEWGQYNITINAIAPGMIKTDMIKPFENDENIIQGTLDLIPLGRLGEAHEVGLLALFLCSGASDYISGQVFTIDGGARGRGTGI